MILTNSGTNICVRETFIWKNVLMFEPHCVMEGSNNDMICNGIYFVHFLCKDAIKRKIPHRTFLLCDFTSAFLSFFTYI